MAWKYNTFTDELDYYERENFSFYIVNDFIEIPYGQEMILTEDLTLESGELNLGGILTFIQI